MCHQINDTVLSLIALKLANLQELNVSLCNITSSGCCHIARMHNLRAVDITSAAGINGQAICAMVTGSCKSSHNTNSNDVFEDEVMRGKEISIFEVDQGHKRATSNLTAIIAQFAMFGVDEHLFETIATHAPRLKILDLRNYIGDDIGKDNLSPMKMSVRKLERKGTIIAFSRAKGYS